MFCSQFKGTVHRGGDGMGAGVCGSCSQGITHSQEAEKGRLLLHWLSLFIQSSTSHGTVLATFRVLLPASINPIKQFLHRHVQTFVSKLILDPDKLMRNISHHIHHRM